MTFECIDAHTCGNPVRLVVSGAPDLGGDTIAEKRLHFMREHDWIRTGLMFEPRGHDMMSGSILYPPADPSNDAAVLFIETSGCLPMCGHGMIGTVTIAIENRLIIPKQEGRLQMETPAGLVSVEYQVKAGRVDSVRITNVISFLHTRDIEAEVTGLGRLAVDVSFGGNFYAIVDEQENFAGIDHYPVDQLIFLGREVRSQLNQRYSFVHPEDQRIRGCSHVLWAGKPKDKSSTARNAVLYGEKAIDRSPCGTGTSARMAQWYARGRLRKGELFIHESIIGSRFTGRIEEELMMGELPAIRPSIEGWARIYGRNSITIDPKDDPYAYGFQVI
jgi:4-hydroxyproline epimerase